jgi:hypothetical protein
MDTNHENGASVVGELDGVRYREMHDSSRSWSRHNAKRKVFKNPMESARL